MGQFKPMVKMETTEPSVILKLKKGGHATMKKGGKEEAGHKKMAMGGGAMDMMMGTPALVGRPAVNAPVRAPGKPSMASRRKAMMAKKPAMMPPTPEMGMPPMKKGGMACAEGGESKSMHKAEMKAIKGVDSKLTKHASMTASKGHKGLKTGGVAMGNAGGFKAGGMAMGGCKTGGMAMVEKGGKMVPSFAADGKGKMKMGGKTCATGGVALGNAGGFKNGGKSSKKAYAMGGTVNSGRAVAMPQGYKKPSQPVGTKLFAGTFKKGGNVTSTKGNLMKSFGKENASAMKSAKAQSNDVYSKYQKMAGGGSPDAREAAFLKEGKDEYEAKKEAAKLAGASDAHYAREEADNRADRKMLDDALMYLPRKAMGAFNMLTGSKPKSGSVTKTEKSVTVSPAGKRRGGRAC